MDIKFYNILETKSKAKNLGDVQIVKMSGGGTNRWNTDLVPHLFLLRSRNNDLIYSRGG